MTTPVLGIVELATGQNSKEAKVNDAIRRAELFLQPQISVTRMDLSAAPTGVEGEIFIVASTPSGSDPWGLIGAAADDLVGYSNGGWVRQTPREGWRVYNIDDATQYIYDASPAWVPSAALGGVASVKDDGSTIVSSVTSFNFKGPGVVASSPGAGQADITVDNRCAVPATRTTTSETLALTDAGAIVLCSNASAQTLTVPPNSSVAFDVGTVIVVKQMGAGIVTIAEGAGVNVRSFNDLYDLAGQYAECSLVKIATDEWALSGNLA